mmetsp:Transcript_12953/g.34897  ORF Transcript_12953/g.34897 Transcript_12953/m.34897 type:complete len:369 (-) Transcript_12953:58-1164(-)
MGDNYYPHQVGGHGLLRRSGSTPDRLFKPLDLKEFAMYQAVSCATTPADVRALSRFMPQYYGAFKIAKPEPEPAQKGEGETGKEVTEVQHAVAKGHRARMKQVDPLPHLQAGIDGSCSCGMRHNTGGDHGITQSWLEMYNSMRYDFPNTSCNDITGLYTCLEDVNARFIQPCVLDVKIGTRHYDDDATPEKRARHMEKSRQSTTAQYGLRLCGMRTYDAVKNEVQTVGKLSQNKLEPHAVPAHLRAFFSNGRELRTDAISEVLQRCEELRAAMAAQRTLSFYSSSVLIVYEGDEIASRELAGAAGSSRGVAGLWLIDFAHTQPRVLPENDDGYVFGLTNLSTFLRELLASRDQPSSPDPVQTLAAVAP